MHQCESVDMISVATDVIPIPSEPGPSATPSNGSTNTAIPRTSKLGSFLNSVPAVPKVAATVHSAANSGRLPAERVRVVEKLLGEAKPIASHAASEMATQLKETNLINQLKSAPRKDDGVLGASDAPLFDPKELAERFRRQQRMALGEAMALIQEARRVLAAEQTMLELQPKLTGPHL